MLTAASPIDGQPDASRRRGDYGFDAPYVPLWHAAAGTVVIGVAAVCFVYAATAPGWTLLAAGVLLLLSSASFVWTTRRGKFAVWDELLDQLALHGDERVLDVGCGRGMVLLMVAERLTSGRAVGADIWSAHDQSGNAEAVTLANAGREGVLDRIELHTADMRALPFPDQSFDLVTAGLAIHNIAEPEGRARALVEIWRVLKPGGIALIVDFRHLDIFQRYFASQPGATVERRELGWRYWYAGPHQRASLVKVTRANAATL